MQSCKCAASFATRVSLPARQRAGFVARGGTMRGMPARSHISAAPHVSRVQTHSGHIGKNVVPGLDIHRDPAPATRHTPVGKSLRIFRRSQPARRVEKIGNCPRAIVTAIAKGAVTATPSVGFPDDVVHSKHRLANVLRRIGWRLDLASHLHGTACGKQDQR